MPALLAGESLPSPTGGVSVPVARMEIVKAGIPHETVRTFRPSSFPKQKRKIKKRVTFWGLAILAATLALMVGLTWLLVWTWPLLPLWAAWLSVLGGGMVGVVMFFSGLFAFSYSYKTDRDLRFDALARLERLTAALPFEAEKAWCLGGEHFRLSVARGKTGWLIVDYQADKGWILPLETLVSKEGFELPLKEVESKLAAGEGELRLFVRPSRKRRQAPLRPDQPMQVLRFKVSEGDVRVFTLVYELRIQDEAAADVAR